MGVRAPGVGESAGRTAHPWPQGRDRDGVPMSALPWPAWSAPIAVVVMVALVLAVPAVVEFVVGVLGVRLNTDGLPAWATLVLFFVRELVEIGVAIVMAWRLTPRRYPAPPRSAVWPADWTSAAIGMMAVLICSRSARR